MQANPQAQSRATEGAEAKEILQHFAPDQTLRAESNTTLSAFAQLAVLRLRGKRAVISLIDDKNQYILVEATQDSRLRSDQLQDDEDEGLLFGRKKLARSLGLCGNALDIIYSREAGAVRDESPRRSLSPLIINDVMGDERFRNLPFVTRHPSVRFYAAMPIITKSRFHIGTISVMDERPREGLSEDEINFLSDVGPAILANLEMTRTSEAQRRSGKMIKGLGVFMEGGTDLQDWWLELGNNESRAQDDVAASQGKEREEPTAYSGSVSRGHDDPPSLPHPSLNSPDKTQAEFDGSLAVANKLLVSTPMEYSDAAATTTSGCGDGTSPRSSDSRLAQQPLPETSAESPDEAPPPNTGQSSRTFTADWKESLIPERLKELFSRAGHIIQESIEVDGALFLDARISTLSERSESVTSTETEGRSRNSTGESTSSGQESIGNDNENQRSRAEPSVDGQSGSREEPSCGILGLWTSESSSLHGDRESNLVPLKESFIQTLLHKYPQGHVFSPGERCPYPKNEKRRSARPSEQSDADALSKMFPGARSIAFVPLWDPSQGRWFAGGFMWTVLPTDRVLTRSGDRDYLAAFGNSIMAEVARLEVVRTDRAKSDFISSISHELRSPLHGILASAELLRDTTVDLFQYDRIDTIERCGRTLLDTIQHVLDFAKINNFARSQKNRGGHGAAKKRPGGGGPSRACLT